jgi:hypothetical protein
MSAETCPICFNCQNTPCQNFGTCSSSLKCACTTGFGSEDCSKPLCGSLSKYSETRVVSNLLEPCNCDDDWKGPNCHVCQADSVCISKTIGTSLVCNKSPVVSLYLIPRFFTVIIILLAKSLIHC